MLILNSLKIPEGQRFYNVFSEYKKETLERYGLIALFWNTLKNSPRDNTFVGIVKKCENRAILGVC